MKHDEIAKQAFHWFLVVVFLLIFYWLTGLWVTYGPNPV